MLLNRVWMIGKNAPALAPSPWTTGVCFKCSPRPAAPPRYPLNPSVKRWDWAATFALRKAPSSAPVAAGSTAIRALPAKNPCWRCTAWPYFPFLFCGAGTFSTTATTRLLLGLAVLRPGLVGSPRPPMKSPPLRRQGFRPPRGTRAADGLGLRSARAAAYAPWSTPSGRPPPVPAAEIWPRRRACRGPADKRQQTTSSDPSASDETPCPR